MPGTRTSGLHTTRSTRAFVCITHGAHLSHTRASLEEEGVCGQAEGRAQPCRCRPSSHRNQSCIHVVTEADPLPGDAMAAFYQQFLEEQRGSHHQYARCVSAMAHLNRVRLHVPNCAYCRQWFAGNFALMALWARGRMSRLGSIMRSASWTSKSC